MVEANKQSRSLLTRFKEFQSLHLVQQSKARKKRVRNLEKEVKRGEVTIGNEQVQEYLASDFELARILVYLLMENSKVNADQATWRANILSEWELLQRHALSHDLSRMPLYYAVRTYLTRLKATPDLQATVASDRFLMREIESALAKSTVDQNSQVRRRIAELLALMESDNSSSSNPTIMAAFISRRGAVLAAVIAAIAAIGVGLMTNWDKISPRGTQHVAPTTPTPKQ
jgi:hypothetical protein